MATAATCGVVPFVAASGVDQRAADNIAALVSTEVDIRGGYDLVLAATPGEVKPACAADLACSQQWAKGRGHAFVVVGKVEADGSAKYKLTTQIVEVASGRTVKQLTRSLDKPADRLLELVPDFVAELITGKSPMAAAAAEEAKKEADTKSLTDVDIDALEEEEPVKKSSASTPSKGKSGANEKAAKAGATSGRSGAAAKSEDSGSADRRRAAREPEPEAEEEDPFGMAGEELDLDELDAAQVRKTQKKENEAAAKRAEEERIRAIAEAEAKKKREEEERRRESERRAREEDERRLAEERAREEEEARRARERQLAEERRRREDEERAETERRRREDEERERVAEARKRDAEAEKRRAEQERERIAEERAREARAEESRSRSSASRYEEEEAEEADEQEIDEEDEGTVIVGGAMDLGEGEVTIGGGVEDVEEEGLREGQIIGRDSSEDPRVLRRQEAERRRAEAEAREDDQEADRYAKARSFRASDDEEADLDRSDEDERRSREDRDEGRGSRGAASRSSSRDDDDRASTTRGGGRYDDDRVASRGEDRDDERDDEDFDIDRDDGRASRYRTEGASERATARASKEGDRSHLSVRVGAGYSMFYLPALLQWGADIGVFPHKNVSIDVAVDFWSYWARKWNTDGSSYYEPSSVPTFHVGASFRGNKGVVRPYVGGGLTVVYVQGPIENVNGVWDNPLVGVGGGIKGGADFFFTKHFGLYAGAKLGVAYAPDIHLRLENDWKPLGFYLNVGAGAAVRF